MVCEFECIMAARILPAKQRAFRILDSDNLSYVYKVFDMDRIMLLGFIDLSKRKLHKNELNFVHAARFEKSMITNFSISKLLDFY